jgi:endonuclease/exonuclease/phosphatase family metal-dependent hydrolase
LHRILTYNVHRCVGTDGRLSPERIADVIAEADPDVVALQELDVGRRRTGGVDQAQAIADRLGMVMHFHPAMKVVEELYGDAILTAAPSRLVKAGPLPQAPGAPHAEPRGALWVTVDLDGHRYDVINTHLGLRGAERMAQVEALLGPAWIGSQSSGTPLILAGDFNAVPASRAYRRIAATLLAGPAGERHRAPRTFPSRLPVLALDHVFVSDRIAVRRVAPLRSRLARSASDHLPLLVELELNHAALGGAVTGAAA